MKTLSLYVKPTNCGGMPLQEFELLGPVWTGDDITIPFIDPDAGYYSYSYSMGDDVDDVVVCSVTGWTDLFSGRPCMISAAWVRRLPQPTEIAEEIAGWPFSHAVGILLWGGNAGVRIVGPSPYYEDGQWMPVIFLEDDGLIPDHVRDVIRPDQDQSEK